MKMDLAVSVWTSYFVDYTPEEMIDAFVEAGYTTAEFSDEHGFVLLKRAKERGMTAAEVGAELKAYADARGFSFPQGHLYLGVDPCADNAVEILTEWLDLFVALGITAGVLHTQGGRELTDEERFDRWVKTLKPLCAHLEGTNMSIALENVGGNPTLAGLKKVIDAVGSDHLGICLDTGHLKLAQERGITDMSQLDFIRGAGKLLIALHIADNDGTSDQHMMPLGRGRVNWWEVMTGLREVGYDRLFNYEIPGERQASPKVRMAKLEYIKAVTEELFSDEFVERGHKVW